MSNDERLLVPHPDPFVAKKMVWERNEDKVCIIILPFPILTLLLNACENLPIIRMHEIVYSPNNANISHDLGM